MTALAPALPAAAPAPRGGAHRALGLLGVLGAPAFPLIGSPAAAQSHALRPTLLMLAYLAGWACSAAGLRRLRATGRGAGTRTVTVVQGVGLALAAGQLLQDAAEWRPLGHAGYLASDLAWPLSHLFMLAVCAAVWRAGVWRGWRRWTPLACGLVLPVTMALGAAGLPAAALVWPAGTTAAFAALGLAVATADARAARPAPARP